MLCCSQSSKPPTILSELCDGFRQVLKQRDFVVYVNCILTAYVMRKPAQYEEGLTVLLNLRGDSKTFQPPKCNV